MKHAFLALATILMPLVSGAVRADGDSCMSHSQEILASMQQGDYNTATAHFDQRMLTAVDADKLAQIWGTLLPAQFGVFKHKAESTSSHDGNGMDLVETPLEFDKGWLNMQVSCSADGKVAGLFFKPGQAPAGTTSAPDTSGSSAGARMHDNEHAVNVPTPLGPLPGILTRPKGKGPWPAVLLVAGSGPNDRDETIGPNKPFLDLAQGLAGHGIASLRYDKRTHAYPGKIGQHITVDDEVTDDAVSALQQLKSQPDINPQAIFVLGHSLGALMAPRIARRSTHLAGVIMLSAPTALNLDLILRQTRYVAKQQGASPQKIKEIAAPIIAARDAMARADPSNPPEGTFFHAPASYWLSLRDYHPIEVARKLQIPMLILQGGGDYQITPAQDYARWKAAFDHDQRVTLKLYPGLSHLFMPAGDPPSPLDYQKPGHVDEHVVDDIAAWLRGHTG